MGDHNSSGERMYKDSKGVNCNLRGMFHCEPEWVVSRFAVMEDEIVRLHKINADRLAMVKQLHGVCLDPASQPNHQCGPEGNCDCDCVGWARQCEIMVLASKLIAAAAQGADHA